MKPSLPPMWLVRTEKDRSESAKDCLFVVPAEKRHFSARHPSDSRAPDRPHRPAAICPEKLRVTGCELQVGIEPFHVSSGVLKGHEQLLQNFRIRFRDLDEGFGCSRWLAPSLFPLFDGAPGHSPTAPQIRPERARTGFALALPMSAGSAHIAFLPLPLFLRRRPALPARHPAGLSDCRKTTLRLCGLCPPWDNMWAQPTHIGRPLEKQLLRSGQP